VNEKIRKHTLKMQRDCVHFLVGRGCSPSNAKDI